MPSFAITFPGQGSQSVGMLNAYPDFPGIQKTLEEASEILNLDFARLIGEGPTEELARTINTQPVMLTVSSPFKASPGISTYPPLPPGSDSTRPNRVSSIYFASVPRSTACRLFRERSCAFPSNT